MRSDEPPKARYDRLKRQLQHSVLSEYPNPERKGCPGNEALQSLAAQSSDKGFENDTSWSHVTHCSECYREVLDIRSKLKNKAKRRIHITTWTIAAAAVLAIAVGMLLWNGSSTGFFPERPQNAEVAYSKLTIDIPSMTRSEAGTASLPILFDRKREELTVNLPVGSKGGPYEFRLLKDDRPIVSTHADAAIRNGTTAFTVKIDLSLVASGSYAMSVRQVAWDWNYFPVVVR